LKRISDGIYLVNGSNGNKYNVDTYLDFCECKSHYFNRIKAFKNSEYPKDCKHLKMCKQYEKDKDLQKLTQT